MQQETGAFTGVPFIFVIELLSDKIDGADKENNKTVARKVLRRMIEKDKSVLVMGKSAKDSMNPGDPLLILNPDPLIQQKYFGSGFQTASSGDRIRITPVKIFG